MRDSLICYFGHHKCASTWFANILNAVGRDLGVNTTAVSTRQEIPESFQTFARNHESDILLFRNAKPSYPDKLQRYSGFHVIRDPRDILVSSYFSHRFSHPTTVWPQLVQIRERLEKAPKEEGFFLEMDFLAPLFQDMAGWNYQNPWILELKYEDIILNPYQAWLEIFQFVGILDPSDATFAEKIRQTFHISLTRTLFRLGLRGRSIGALNPLTTLNAERLLGIVYDYRFARMALQRKPGEENVQSHFRKGVSGDWKNHFTPAITQQFKEKFPTLLQSLNYESNSDWSCPPL